MRIGVQKEGSLPLNAGPCGDGSLDDDGFVRPCSPAHRVINHTSHTVLADNNKSFPSWFAPSEEQEKEAEIKPGEGDWSELPDDGDLGEVPIFMVPTSAQEPDQVRKKAGKKTCHPTSNKGKGVDPQEKGIPVTVDARVESVSVPPNLTNEMLAMQVENEFLKGSQEEAVHVNTELRHQLEQLQKESAHHSYDHGPVAVQACFTSEPHGHYNRASSVLPKGSTVRRAMCGDDPSDSSSSLDDDEH